MSTPDLIQQITNGKTNNDSNNNSNGLGILNVGSKKNSDYTKESAGSKAEESCLRFVVELDSKNVVIDIEDLLQKRYENSDNNNNMNGNGFMSVDGPITTVPNLHSNGNNNINGIVTSPGKGVKMISKITKKIQPTLVSNGTSNSTTEVSTINGTLNIRKKKKKNNNKSRTRGLAGVIERIEQREAEFSTGSIRIISDNEEEEDGDDDGEGEDDDDDNKKNKVKSKKNTDNNDEADVDGEENDDDEAEDDDEGEDDDDEAEEDEDDDELNTSAESITEDDGKISTNDGTAEMASTTTTTTTTITTTNNNKTTKKKKKKRKQATYYDMYDPFIDDSELIEMIDNQHDQVKTVHEGFFVNSGELKVVNQGKGKNGKGKSGSSKKEKQNKRTGLSEEDKKLIASLQPNKQIIVREWRENEEIMKAFNSLVEMCGPVFENLDAKGRKAAEKRLPSSLDMALYKLDSILMKLCDNKLPSSLIDELTKHIPYKSQMVRKQMKRLRLREKTNRSKEMSMKKLEIFESKMKEIFSSPETRENHAGMLWHIKADMDAKESAEISWTDHFTEFYTTKKPLEINEIPKLLKSSLVKNREAQFLMEQYKVANNITEENGNETYGAPASLLKIIEKREWYTWNEPEQIALFQAVDTHTDFIDVQNDYFETLWQNEFDDYCHQKTEKTKAIKKCMSFIPKGMVDMTEMRKQLNKGRVICNAQERAKEFKEAREAKAAAKLVAKILAKANKTPSKRKRSSSSNSGKKKKTQLVPGVYTLWFRENRPKIREEVEKTIKGTPEEPKTIVGLVRKRSGELWRALTDEDKAPYQAKRDQLLKEEEAKALAAGSSNSNGSKKDTNTSKKIDDKKNNDNSSSSSDGSSSSGSSSSSDEEEETNDETKKSKSNKSKKKKKSNNNTTITTNNKKRKRKSSDSSGNNNVGEDVVHYDVEEDGDGNKTTKPMLFREDSFDYFSFQQYKDSDFNKKEECDIIGGAKDD